METKSTNSASFIGLLHRLVAGVFDVAHERLQLVSIELHVEKLRLIQVFIWISAAVFTAMMAVAFASLTFVYLLEEDDRLAGLGGLAVFYIVALIAICVGFRGYLARQPPPFASTLEELAKDQACIQPEN